MGRQSASPASTRPPAVPPAQTPVELSALSAAPAIPPPPSGQRLPQSPTVDHSSAARRAPSDAPESFRQQTSLEAAATVVRSNSPLASVQPPRRPVSQSVEQAM